MDRITSDIFIPDGKKFHITSNLIVYGLWIFAAGFLWLFDVAFPVKSETRNIICFGLGAISIGFLIASFFRYKQLNGRLAGKVEFQDERIILGDVVFELKDITELDFQFGDFYGRTPTIYVDFNPRTSQGVDNYVSFTDSGNQTHLIYFRLQGEHSYLSLSSFINKAVTINKMHPYRAADLLGVENISA